MQHHPRDTLHLQIQMDFYIIWFLLKCFQNLKINIFKQFLVLIESCKSLTLSVKAVNRILHNLNNANDFGLSRSTNTSEYLLKSAQALGVNTEFELHRNKSVFNNAKKYF